MFCLFNHFIHYIGKEAKIKFCLTPIVILWKLSEWNSFVIRIGFFFLLQQNRMFDTHSALSKNCNNYTEYISITNFTMSKWDYVQSLGAAKIKKTKNRKYIRNEYVLLLFIMQSIANYRTVYILMKIIIDRL